MKIVIISRNIFPALAPRPHRATELAKFFASVGHDVYLYGVLGSYDYTEFEKKTRIHVCSIGKMKFATQNSDGHSRNSFFDKVATRLFKKWIEYPDIELYWKIVGLLKKQQGVDLLITVAVPYPIHWGAARAKKKLETGFPKVWISDCGDPYMGDSTCSHPSYFQKVEDFWGRQTDFITIPIEAGRSAYSPSVQNKIRIVPQGFDFSNVKVDKGFVGNKIPHFAYTGLIYPGYRDPSKMMKFLGKMKDVDFKFIVYTTQYNLYKEYENLLGEKLELRRYVPREQLIYELSQMDFLINLQNKSKVQAPSKLIDFYLSERPIIDITTEFSEEKNLLDFLRGDYSNHHIKQDITQFDIVNVGQKFLDIYHESINRR